MNRIEFGYGGSVQSGLEWLVFVVSYTGTFFGGLLARVSHKRQDRFLGTSTMLLACYIGALYGSRMGVLFGGSFWLSSYVASQVLFSAGKQSEELRFLLRMTALSLGVMVGLSLGVMTIRYTLLSDTRSFSRDLSETFIFVPAFCLWFNDEGLEPQKKLLGYRTFRALYERLGIYHDDQEWAIPVENTSSNIFTVFRGVIEDFGLLGSCVWFFVFGLIGALGYRAVTCGYPFALPLLTCVFAYTFVGTSFSLFTYNAPNAAILAFTTYFLCRRTLVRVSSGHQGMYSSGYRDGWRNGVRWQNNLRLP